MEIYTDNSKVIEGLEAKITELENTNQSLGYECAAMGRKIAELETKHAVCVRDRNHYRKLILEALKERK